MRGTFVPLTIVGTSGVSSPCGAGPARGVRSARRVRSARGANSPRGAHSPLAVIPGLDPGISTGNVPQAAARSVMLVPAWVRGSSPRMTGADDVRTTAVRT
jgi:hypothetical protein